MCELLGGALSQEHLVHYLVDKAVGLGPEEARLQLKSSWLTKVMSIIT